MSKTPGIGRVRKEQDLSRHKLARRWFAISLVALALLLGLVYDQVSWQSHQELAEELNRRAMLTASQQEAVRWYQSGMRGPDGMYLKLNQ